MSSQPRTNPVSAIEPTMTPSIGLTSLFDVGEHRSDPDADNLVRHILEMPEGNFEDLIETSNEGVDVIPNHDMLRDFTSNLEQKIPYETGMRKPTATSSGGTTSCGTKRNCTNSTTPS